MKRLIVIVPGLDAKEADWAPLKTRLQTEPELQCARWVFWSHNCTRYDVLRFRRARTLAASLAATINQEWLVHGGFDDVILVGHSMGGQLIREAYLMARGALPGEVPNYAWAGTVSRIVLLASINRGFNPDNRLSHRVLAWLALRLGILRFTLAYDLMRGSNHVTDVRLHWMRYVASLGDRAPLVVQLLGDQDGVVRREDSLDVEQFPNGHFILVPGSDHRSIHRLDKVDDPDGRYALIRWAFFDITPEAQVPPNDPVDIVFILHGMNASRDGWVKWAVNDIRTRYPRAVVVQPSYDFVSPLDFILPARRREHIGWFQDQYSQLLAEHPSARFHFIGHSNGTYIFGHSLAMVSGIHFQRVYFAGSALPRKYPLRLVFDRKQIEWLRNDRSDRDCTIGILARSLSLVSPSDVGTAGADGFNEDHDHKDEVFFYAGGHSRPLEEKNIGNIVDYVFDPNAVEPREWLNGSTSVGFGILTRALAYMIPAGIAVAVYLSIRWWNNDWKGVLATWVVAYVILKVL